MNRFAIILCLAAAAGCAQTAEQARPSITVETTAVSQYLWRGTVLNDSPSVQPGVTVEYRGFSVMSWSNFSRTVPNHQAWTEHDLCLEYSHEAGDFTLSAGFLDYRFPDLTHAEGNRTTEVSLGVAYKNYLSPTFKVYKDVSLGRGYYHALGFSHSYGMRHGLALTPAVTLGVNQHMYQPATTVSDVDFGLTLDIPVGNVTISPLAMVMTGNRSLFGTHSAFGVKFSYTK
ncbi:MAG TPA: TorF family putative porin [Bryobacteraceae bacterium]|nr:TorF family putative porin [Bryobacteraceae bacterium]